MNLQIHYVFSFQKSRKFSNRKSRPSLVDPLQHTKLKFRCRPLNSFLPDISAVLPDCKATTSMFSKLSNLVRVNTKYPFHVTVKLDITLLQWKILEDRRRVSSEDRYRRLHDSIKVACFGSARFLLANSFPLECDTHRLPKTCDLVAVSNTHWVLLTEQCL